MKHTWKKAAASLLATALVVGAVPTNVGAGGLFGGNSTSITAYAAKETTITWDSSDMAEEINGKISTYKGITITGFEQIANAGYEVQIAYDGKMGSFQTDLGNFTKIEVIGGWTNNNFPSGEEWVNRTWTGNASEVPFTGGMTSDMNNQPFTITFTIALTPVDVSSVTLDTHTALMTVGGEALTLSPTVLPDNATDKTVTWSSSNNNVATVDETGKVTAVAEGTATITATAGDGSGVKDECVVTVINPKLANGEYMQTAEKDGKYFTRFVFVTPKTEIEGKDKATFTAHYNGNDYTFETNNYYTGMITNGVTYTPDSEDSVLLVVTITSGSDISADLTCDIDFE